MQTLVSAHIVSDAPEFMSGSRIRVDQLQITLYTFVFSIYSEAAVPHIRTHTCDGKRRPEKMERTKKKYTINELTTKYLPTKYDRQRSLFRRSAQIFISSLLSLHFPITEFTSTPPSANGCQFSYATEMEFWLPKQKHFNKIYELQFCDK